MALHMDDLIGFSDEMNSQMFEGGYHMFVLLIIRTHNAVQWHIYEQKVSSLDCI